MSRPRSTTATAAKLETHEAVCAERYAGLLQRLGRLELVVWSANGGVLAVLLATAAFFLSHKLG